MRIFFFCWILLLIEYSVACCLALSALSIFVIPVIATPAQDTTIIANNGNSSIPKLCLDIAAGASIIAGHPGRSLSSRRRKTFARPFSSDRIGAWHRPSSKRSADARRPHGSCGRNTIGSTAQQNLKGDTALLDSGGKAIVLARPPTSEEVVNNDCAPIEQDTMDGKKVILGTEGKAIVFATPPTSEENNWSTIAEETTDEKKVIFDNEGKAMVFPRLPASEEENTTSRLEGYGERSLANTVKSAAKAEETGDEKRLILIMAEQ